MRETTCTVQDPTPHAGFEGEVEWDKSKPDGQPKRRLDTTKAKKEFGFVARVSLREGLKRTIEWYEKSCVGVG